ncbi:uncharacterized protein LY79DRAFT_573097 [Colletotrichum navitas]|uniref:Uncharacterized protein n=1 Tax=Colletotrichum navitas TaxID=681940 RepID=A0AAD8PKG1_9PEZI|nr:uncharacterized protein LY79DRAFT_573097 [Colletotrichum navitas]KAK1565930.1 hypothetical protein LY79DRAFT_573097 [Colletotrichum navitas]
MAGIDDGSSLHLKDAKNTVPSEHTTSAGVRQWLLRHLENRNVELPNGPVGFVCHWNGVELHSLHPNHLFGSLISQGVVPQTAHHVVGDVMECLQEYRAKRSFSLAADQAWAQSSESELGPRLGDEEEQDERRILLGGEGDGETFSRGSGSPQSWYYSLAGSRGGWLAAAGVSILTGIGVIAWWVAGSSTQERETGKHEFLVKGRQCSTSASS